MARYILTNRRSGKFTEEAKVEARGQVGLALNLAAGATVVRNFEPKEPTARRGVLLEMEPDASAALAKQLPPDVIFEPEVLHWTCPVVPLDFIQQSQPLTGLSTGTGHRLRVQVRGDGQPLEGATVTAYFRGRGGRLTAQDTRQTNAKGTVDFQHDDFWIPAAVVVVPTSGYWAMIARGPSRTVAVDCPALPQDGPLQWWHDAVGINRYQAKRGEGIKVGVIDTGVGPHPHLSHVTDAGGFIGGNSLPGQGKDVDTHGTHVCGIIGARPDTNSQDYGGIAPGVDLYSARVFEPNSGANQLDIANAIDELSKTHKVDLINLSLGAASASQVEEDAIQDAEERGTLCVCAAGNSAGAVLYPAAFSTTVAVSALGLAGWGPSGSIAASRLPGSGDKFGDKNFYLANFSCFGNDITCTAPGVGIISTVPKYEGADAPYAAMGGTSMASPAACAALAVRLSNSDPYKNTSRDQTRTDTARSILRNICEDISLATVYQGRGLLQAE